MKFGIGRCPREDFEEWRCRAVVEKRRHHTIRRHPIPLELASDIRPLGEFRRGNIDLLAALAFPPTQNLRARKSCPDRLHQTIGTGCGYGSSWLKRAGSVSQNGAHNQTASLNPIEKITAKPMHQGMTPSDRLRKAAQRFSPTARARRQPACGPIVMGATNPRPTNPNLSHARHIHF